MKKNTEFSTEIKSLERISEQHIFKNKNTIQKRDIRKNKSLFIFFITLLLILKNFER
ncbi:hypothetical protein LEP1GSC038_3277 [Leptospira weilii str. 2006001855]|uniref:Uncharacterized protein n=1 Tax=Leptospira weilii str. 2006001855 TaxID=996804 RepID=M6FQU7_9LEPT|nr:hypothetical protein LEP1GSC038_3277 [Leptospira weilii str. 2006001855]